MPVSPPRPNPPAYHAPYGTRWEKEKAEAGGAHAYDLPTDPSVLGPWLLGECVGKGASGRVKIAKHSKTGQLAAVKILPKAPSYSSYREQCAVNNYRLGVDREIITLKLMKHPNIIRIYDVYEGQTELFIVLEYVEGGELFDYLVNKGRLDEDTAWAIFRQIICGLNYAHTFSIIHRDIKLENILMESINPPLVKIVDWGMAAFAHPSLVLETSCGSPHYASPEIASGNPYQGTATDIWSCGVILYTLLAGKLPFDDKDTAGVLHKVRAGRYEMPSNINPQAQDLLRKMLVMDAGCRITMPEILVHPWLATPRYHSHPQSHSRGPEPPLPPSPSRLARPIVSPDLIDPELFESLRVIWGRHTDTHGKSIEKDLCSPPGQGEHAKAFYYLLSKYREEKWQHCSEDNLSDSDTGSQPSSPIHERYTIKPRSSHSSMRSGLEPTYFSTERETARGQVSGRTSRRGYRPSDVIAPFNPVSPSRKQDRVHLERSEPAFIIDSTDNRYEGLIHHERPSPRYSFTGYQGPCSPSCGLGEIRRRQTEVRRPSRPRAVTIAHLNTCVIENHSLMSRRGQEQLCQMSVRPGNLQQQLSDMHPSRTLLQSEKENQALEGWTMIDAEDNEVVDGRNSLEASVSPRKKNLSRPPPLDLRPLRRRKSIFGSPATTNFQRSHITNNSSRFFPSPVGELKGWFSSLFSWKGRLGTMVSHRDIVHTCDEVKQVLEEIGVLVEHDVDAVPEPRSEYRMLKCRVESSTYQHTGIYLKPIRFQVEVSMAPFLDYYQSSFSSNCSPISPEKSFEFLSCRSDSAKIITLLSSSNSDSPTRSKQPCAVSRSSERQCFIAVVHEKGSTSTFKIILKKLRETYGDEPMDISDDTPVLVSSPYL